MRQKRTAGLLSVASAASVPRATHAPRPTREQLAAAGGRTIPDVVAPGLSVLFCGINPGLYSGATGHHFARPGNRFWPALHAAGFTPRLLAPWEKDHLLEHGCGVTNLVPRTTATAAELTREELLAGRRRLARLVRRFRPRWVAVVGFGAYRTAFERPKAVAGRQPDRLEGAGLWLLPNPSGLNANHRLADFTRAFRALKRAAEREAERSAGQARARRPTLAVRASMTPESPAWTRRRRH